MRSRRRALLVASVALALAGCGASPMTPAPPAPSPLASAVSHEQLQSWITFRLVYGLRADVEWVIEVAKDPLATDIFGPPLLMTEAQQVSNAQQSAADLVSTARGYGNRFLDEFAGAWIEGPLVVLAFSGGIEAHRTAVTGLFGDMVVVRSVQFSLRQLEPFAADVTDDPEWFRTVGAELVDADVDEQANVVRVHIRWPDLAVEAAARARFGDTGWMSFTYDGPPPWTGPRGDLEVTIVDRDGQLVSARCVLGSEDPRVMEEHVSGSADGRCFYQDLPAASWTLRIEYDLGADSLTALRDFVIPADGVERATVIVGP